MSTERKIQEKHPTERWLDTWWPLLLILFTMLFWSMLVFWHPTQI